MGGRTSNSGMGGGTPQPVAPVITPPEVGARWDSKERKVTYRASFNDASGERVTVSGYLSKSYVIQEMRSRGASEEDIKRVREAFKNIDPKAYRR